MAQETYYDQAFDLIEICKAEKNTITKYWQQYGINADCEGQTQALIQQQREYCDKCQCLR